MIKKNPGTVRIFNAALDEEGDDIILRGSIDPDSLGALRTDDYQREAIVSQPQINAFIEAFRKGTVPDIDLGMRGAKATEPGPGVWMLKDEVYIVDGLQRVTAALQMLERHDQPNPRLGATIRFNTTREFELHRFQLLNTARTKMSPNVILRNLRESEPGVELLLRLSEDPHGHVYNLVSWGQRMGRGDIFTARMFAMIAARLHSYHGASKASKVEVLGGQVTRLSEEVGPRAFRDNVSMFFEMLDEVWGIKSIKYKQQALHIKGSFLFALCALISRHQDFWDETKLVFPKFQLEKLGSFPLNDPHVSTLAAGSGTQGTLMLYQLMLEHMNKGRRSRQLSLRAGLSVTSVLAEDDIDEAEEDENGQE